MNKFDSIIIGSGVGGLSTALLLANEGKKVLVLEKNELLGGRLTSYTRDGFTVDLGVHVISRSNKGPLGEVFDRVGLETGLEFQKLRPVTSYNGKIFVFPHDLKDMMPEEEFNALMKFMVDIREMTDEEVSSYDDISIDEFLKKYTDNDMASSCVFNMAQIYTCLSSWLVSAGEFMRCMRYEAAARASGYPIGGCGAITNAYVKAIESKGGEIKNNAKVDSIVIEDNRAVGVKVGDIIYEADTVISNADIKATVFNLVGQDYFDSDYIKYVKDLEYSWTGPVVRVALDEKISDIKMLTQFGSLKQKEYYGNMEKGIMPDELNLFLVCPSNFSPTVAPEGKQLINFATPIPLGLPKNIVDNLQEAMIKTVEKYIPDLREHILWMEYTTTNELCASLGEMGAGIGIGQRVGQVGKKRPSNKTSIDGLYLVGAEAGGSGVGIELAINSALELFDNYL
ncbi:Phytoene dehydrogenase-related protein [Dethiosulfatibacter aminovorans DSM 17477]|uniref:Phytoene dehydrogenase-related protein n=1 Tax=Dethiosulfatibacter aminovorans DSM 17477 TaxID=1121476 RepID=A0A1M6EYM0_9FIRM|nr:NAD(P)/FAD-dependent oxidoreductase [Dethiosulfatibacter aminovorans]SHI90554.1 Phytoene dehydrogenase-related protein [Dethiosulfatibacter aminovorans DSM 17477]